MSINLTQGEGAKKAIRNAVVYSFEQPAATGPIIQSITDPTVGTPDLLPLSAMVLIQGMRLSLNGDINMPLPAGNYIVVVGNKSYKAQVSR